MLTLQALQERRTEQYHQRPHPRAPTEEQAVARLLDWQLGDVEGLANRLAQEGRLCKDVRIEGLQGKCLVSAD